MVCLETFEKSFATIPLFPPTSLGRDLELHPGEGPPYLLHPLEQATAGKDVGRCHQKRLTGPQIATLAHKHSCH